MGSLDNFQHQKIIVVGDVMLDRYWWGNVDRISPEAPVPVVHISSSTCAAGGAANVAANITGLGATSILFGVVGNDLEADELSDAMGSAGVSSEFLVRSDSRTTIVKTRIVAHGQHVVRVDRETVAPLSETEEAIVLQNLIPLISDANAVLISDYNKGLLTPGVLSAVIKEAKDKEIPIFVDPKGVDYSRYAGATLLTPNRREAIEACSLDEAVPDVIRKAGSTLLGLAKAENVLITQGENGMTLFSKTEMPFHLRATALETYDVTGAGDTVIATVAVAFAAGFNLEQSAALANIAAGHVVQQVGTSIIKLDDLKREFEALLNDQSSETALTFGV